MHTPRIASERKMLTLMKENPEICEQLDSLSHDKQGTISYLQEITFNLTYGQPYGKVILTSEAFKELADYLYELLDDEDKTDIWGFAR